MDNPSDIFSLCRLCLVKDQVNISIFDEQGDIRQIFLKISSCLPIKVSRDDKLPKKICDDCSNKLDLLYEFWNSSANAEKTLLSWLGQAGVKDAGGTINAVAQQIAKPTETLVKLESGVVEGNSVLISPCVNNVDNESFNELPKEESEAAPPPPKRTRRSAAVKAQINIIPESEDDDDIDTTDLPTKLEDGPEDSDAEDKDPSYTEVPGTSANDQPGPSGVGKAGGVEAPSKKKKKKTNKKKTTTNKKLLNKSIHEEIKKILAKTNNETCNNYKIMFTCEICEYTTSKSVDFAVHSRVHTEKYYCHYCTYKTDIEKNLLKHMRRHGSEKSLNTCSICLELFPDKFQAEQHKNFHSGEMPYSCVVCGKYFMFSWLLNAHNRFLHQAVIKENNLYSCVMCKHTFGTRSGLKKHQTRKHAAKIQHLCDICGKSLANTETLRFHKRTHTGEKPHSCKVCGKSFCKKQLLVEHERVHTGEKPHICLICNKGFTQRGPLKIHLRIHTGERPFICRFCGKGCICKSVLDWHLQKCSGENA